MGKSFSDWLDTYLDEANINLAYSFDIDVGGTWNYIPLEAVIEFMKGLSEDLKYKLKDTMVKIDFANGDMMGFFKHIATGMAMFHPFNNKKPNLIS